MTKSSIDDESFGYKHLKKSGWSEGQGLGRGRDGDRNPIKVNLKHDTAGLGHDQSKEFTNQWWDHVFNKAAAKVTVDTAGDEVTVRSEAEICPEKKQELKRKVLYGNFIKGSTLEQGKETLEDSDTSSASESPIKPCISILTDDELLRACGGRTAHKGARHGFKMNGKLARLEQQDAQTHQLDSPAAADDSGSDSVKRKKSKKRSRREAVEAKDAKDEVEITNEDKLSSDINAINKSKKKKSKKNRADERVEIKECADQQDIDLSTAKKSKKSKKEQREHCEKKKKVKKSKSSKHDSVDDFRSEEQLKPSKKKRRKHVD